MQFPFNRNGPAISSSVGGDSLDFLKNFLQDFQASGRAAEVVIGSLDTKNNFFISFKNNEIKGKRLFVNPRKKALMFG